MNPLRYIISYIPPLTILVFLLLTNLFTRAKVFRNYLFPEKNITVSAIFDDNFFGDDLIPLVDTDNSVTEDTTGCREPLYITGWEYYRAGKLNEAIKIWSSILQSTECSRSALHNNIGLALLKSGKSGKAMNFFSKATEEDSSNATSWFLLGLGQSRKGSRNQAYRSYLQAVKINPGLNRAHFNLGIISMKQEKYTKARDHFRDALSWGMNKPYCFYNIGLCYQKDGSPQKALENYGECIRFAPDQIAARLRMVEIMTALGELDSAAIIAGQAAVIEPGNPDVFVRLARISVDRKAYKEALTYLNRAEVIHPGLIEIAYQRARVYGLRGEDKTALKLYREIIKRDPANPRVYYNIGVNLMDLGMEREALNAYTRSLKVDPSYWKSAYNLGVHYLKQNRFTEAEPFFRRVVQITPDRGEAHYNLGLAYLRAGNFSKAAQSFTQAVKLDTTYIESRYNLALTLMKNGENDSALSQFNSVLFHQPCHTKSLYNMGLIKRKMSDFNGAEIYFARAINCRKGNYPSAWYNRALCKRDLGQIDSALIFLRHARDYSHSENISAKTILLKAGLYEKLGQKDSAEIILSNAETLCRNDPEALGELARFYKRRGEIKRARSIYRQILKTDSTNTELILTAANVESSSGNLIAADSLFQRAIAADEKNVDALMDYAKLLYRLKRYEDALRILQNAMYLKPGKADIRLETALIYARENRNVEYSREISIMRRLAIDASEAYDAGKQLYRAQRYSDAQWFLQEAVKLAPGKSNARYYLLLCNERMGKDDPERQWLAFIEDFPQDYRGYLFLARVYMDRKHYKKAVDLLEKSLNLKDDNDVRYRLARACLALGNSTCALEQAKIYLQYKPYSKKGKKLYADASDSQNAN